MHIIVDILLIITIILILSILSDLDQLPASSNLLTLNVLQSDDKDLYYIVLDEVEKHNDFIYNKMQNKGIKKFYYQNIFNGNNEYPIGFIILSYKDEKYIIPEEDKNEIFKILEVAKTLI